MKILFIGNLEFSFKTLLATLEFGGNVVGICTTKNSVFNSDFCDLSQVAKSKKIPFLYVKDINTTYNLNWIKRINPDVIFCFGWSRLIKKELLSIPKLGIIGYHPAPLPLNRGRHPIIWTIALGLKETASTFFLMDTGADSGDIISKKKILIKNSDKARDVYDRITNSAFKQIKYFLPRLENNSLKKVKQNNALSNFWRKRTIKDGIIDWRMSSRSIHNLVRALSEPYVGAEFIYKDKNYKVWTTYQLKHKLLNYEPGKVIEVNNNCPTIKCGEGAIKLINVKPKIYLQKGEYL
mgnify:CR=1 FL=1